MTRLFSAKLSHTKTNRQSNFELLRIVCMILIIAHHFAVHSVIESTTVINQAIIDAFATGGKIAVNCYVLISGYFLVSSNFKISKFFKLVFELIFYSLIIYAVFCICGYTEFSFFAFAGQILPIFSGRYWFISSYMVMYLLSPFINKLIKNCTHRELLILIGILLLCQIYMPFSGIKSFFGEVSWFITLYLIASYIKLYPNKIFNKNALLIPTFILTDLLILCLYVFFDATQWGMTDALCIVASLSLFCIFKNVNLKNIKFINLISATTLGMYLIHDNTFVRPILWNNWLKVPDHAGLNSFPLFAVLSVAVVFTACFVIDLLRIGIDKLLTKLIHKRHN